MKKVNGKIILVDDERYEKDLLKVALQSKNWDIELEYFNNVEDAMDHLKHNADEIFLIISDMEMPKATGMNFKRRIDKDEYLKQKSIPFIFASNSVSREKVIEAYDYHVQGYFQKPATSDEQAKMLEIIIQYWVACIHPDKSDLPSNPFDSESK